MRGRWLATSAEIPTGQAFGSVFRDRACDVLTLVAALAISLPIVGNAAWVEKIAVGGIVLVAVLVLVFVTAVINRDAVGHHGPRWDRESL